jgi:hypothetical protein
MSLQGNKAARAKRLRDAAGRFRSVTAAERAAGLTTFLKPHGHGRCGKGQYKSAECRAKSIAKSAGANPSARQSVYTKWYQDVR